MQITLPLSSLIIIAIGSVGVTLSVFMGILLLAQKNKNHLSVGLLGLLLILTGLTLLNDLLVTSGISNRIQELYFIPIYYSLSIPPLFYLFVKSKFKFRLGRFDWIHAIIPVVQALVYFSIGFRPVAFKSQLYSESAFRTYLNVESILFPISLVGYTILALALLKKKDHKSFFWTEDIRIWLTRFSYGMLGIAAMEFAFSLLANNSSISSAEVPFYLGHTLILSAFAFWIALNGFRQYYPLKVFTSKPGQSALLIDEEELEQLKEKLSLLMTQNQVFLNPDLNLELLARYLGISEKRCSYLLNTGMGSNFNQYINQLRIDAFKRRIRRGENKTFTLTSIAYDCGFDSKSTFNRVFKSSCGMTPSEYVRRTRATS